MKFTSLPIADLLVVASALLASQFGGRPWAAIALCGLLPLRLLAPSIPTLVASLLLSSFWLAAHQYTGDIRLYFPFTLHFATQLGALLPFSPLRSAIYGSGGIVLPFSVIRLLQSASLIVLLVELLVAAVAVGLPLALFHMGPPNSLRRNAVLILSALLAYLGLVF
jgi:hypothetical protein